MIRFRTARRRVGRRLLRLMLGAAVAAVTTVAVVNPASSIASDKIDSGLSAQLASKQTDFWVVFGDSADLSHAAAVTGWAARGAVVVDALKKTADHSQSSVRARLAAAGVDFEAYHVVNAILVRDGTGALAAELAQRVEVASIEPNRSYPLPTPVKGVPQPTVDAVEWGVAAIRAPQVWSTFGVRGEGIVVANIDTGVQFDHPALVNAYRGNTGGGFDHNYDWFDPARICGNPSLAPCDNNGHGTHTMGTMVGESGANQIGVAPAARWIAAKGCESNGCSTSSLVASGQWMLAPTDLSGANPRPDLRPHVVNNSWGAANGAAVDPFYKAVVNAWNAAGIFPAFSNGNSGPGCNTAGSPGDYNNTYASGAFDINGAIASFSSRGPGEGGVIKPDVSAPGVNVRSSVPGNGYSALSGTSMASPHTAATVALVWSAAPGLIGDLAATQAVLDGTAVDVSDLACGGSPGDNNVWGQGRLDAFAAVQRVRGPRWSDWESLGGGLTSGPGASSWALGRLDVFVRGGDNALYHKWFDNGWSDWEYLGGVLTSDPVAVSWGPGRIDVFARGADDALHHLWFDNGWSSWENLGGVLTSGPGVSSWAPGRLDVFAGGVDNVLHHLWFENGWSGWENLGGVITSDPSAVSWGPGRVDVFARGVDNALWHLWFENGWAAWESLGGALTSGPGVSSWAAGRLDVFVRGLDDGLHHLWFENGWNGWESLGGALTSDPDAVSWGPGRIDVFARGVDNALWHLWFG